MTNIFIGEKMREQLYGVDYVPNWNGKGPHITIWRGSRGGRGCVGATVSPGEALERYKKYFSLADCEWFLEFVKKLADGEQIDTEQIVRVRDLKNRSSFR
jgi:hypothetical protein